MCILIQAAIEFACALLKTAFLLPASTEKEKKKIKNSSEIIFISSICIKLAYLQSPLIVLSIK